MKQFTIILFLLVSPFIHSNAQDCGADIPIQLSEILVDSPLPDDGNAGDLTTAELIEFIGTPGADIGCYSITDGDWTLTFPPQTFIPEDGVFVIGFGAVNGDLVDFEIIGCNCTVADNENEVLILTNGGEYIAFFDNEGNFLEGLIMGIPSGANTPPQGVESNNGVVSLSSVCDIPSVVIPNETAFEVVIDDPDDTFTYIKDALGNWTIQGENLANPLGFGSIGDCNETPLVEGSIFNIKIMLEGAYEGSDTMNTFLGDLIPDMQPYNVSPYNYGGNEQITIAKADIVDWVLVEIRTGTPDQNVQGTFPIAVIAAIVMNDGEVLNPDGTNIQYSLSEETDYYLCIRHRNHLDVLSTFPFQDAPNITYDFTTGVGQAYGPQQLSEVSTGVFALFAGDFNGDGIIQNTDYDLWFANPAQLNIYVSADGNLDGVVQNTDYDKWFNNKAKIGSVEIGL